MVDWRHEMQCSPGNYFDSVWHIKVDSLTGISIYISICMNFKGSNTNSRTQLITMNPYLCYFRRNRVCLRGLLGIGALPIYHGTMLLNIYIDKYVPTSLNFGRSIELRISIYILFVVWKRKGPSSI